MGVLLSHTNLVSTAILRTSIELLFDHGLLTCSRRRTKQNLETDGKIRRLKGTPSVTVSPFYLGQRIRRSD